MTSAEASEAEFLPRAPVYFITQGPGGALAWWIAGIPTDIGHCLGNFFTMLLLYHPLRRILTLRQK